MDPIYPPNQNPHDITNNTDSDDDNPQNIKNGIKKDIKLSHI
jgi:hypothetical protein